MPYDLSRTPAEQLALLFRSGHGLIVCETHEERRVIGAILEAAGSLDRPCFAWSTVRGLVALNRQEKPERAEVTTEPMMALANLDARKDQWVAVFTDLHRHLDDARNLRALRETAERAARQGSSIILVSPVFEAPTELERLVTTLHFPLPDVDFFEKQIRTVYRKVSRDHPHVTHELRQEDLDRITEAMIGLTEQEAERILSQVILKDGRLDANDVESIREAKRATIASRGRLDIMPVSDDLDELGGLNQLKDWLRQRRKAMTEKGRDFGITPPRGVLLLGVPGCGKSFCARLTAGEWRRPLLRMDVGSLYNKFIGNTEANLREALRQADAMEPCVLWIDEIEKAFSGDSGAGGDGGVSQRLFGTMLTWMNDRKSDVFIFATANQVQHLPPELLRKGRFDEIFFVDLPGDEARRQIFDIHLRRRNRDPKDFDVEVLAKHTEGFSGAEIEQAIIGALYDAFNQGEELKTTHIVGELGRTNPISVTMAERIAAMRVWAESRCVMAE